MNRRKFTVVLLPEHDGGYLVHFPFHTGCYTEGDTVEEALEMAKDAIESHLDVLAEDGQDLFLEYARFPHVVVAEIEADLSPAVIELGKEQAAYWKDGTDKAQAPVEASAAASSD